MSLNIRKGGLQLGSVIISFVACVYRLLSKVVDGGVGASRYMARGAWIRLLPVHAVLVRHWASRVRTLVTL